MIVETKDPKAGTLMPQLKVEVTLPEVFAAKAFVG
jgi:hypothetical protein